MADLVTTQLRGNPDGSTRASRRVQSPKAELSYTTRVSSIDAANPVPHDEGPSNICRGNDGRLATCTAKAARSAASGCTCCRADAKLVCVVPDRTAMGCGPTSGMAAPCCGREPARPIACAGACGRIVFMRICWHMRTVKISFENATGRSASLNDVAASVHRDRQMI